jgi:CRISPR-associated endonuclease/helicase Cas3
VDFFRALHGYEPFVWQRVLAERVLRAITQDAQRGRDAGPAGWPRTIEMPTASGKTALLDIAVFAMAADGSHPRRMPRRCFFVVDRRVVVDGAYEKACEVAGKLAEASSGVLRTVADRLRGLSGNRTPLATAILRGGMYLEDNWARTPTQPLLAVSTVDQVASRLLGRGYGVSDRMKPVHQGLLANDSLIILDEAHISAPFEETLAAIEQLRAWAESPLEAPFHVVRMSATLGDEPDFSLACVEELRGIDECLEPRLATRKRARLELVDMPTPPKRKDDKAAWRQFRQSRPERDEIFARACAKAGRCLLDEGRSRLGIVLSRVGLARQVFEAFREREDVWTVLLTGRVRPLHRDRILADILPLIRPDAQADPPSPLVLVATQSIEVGADLDFDALVTDCASLDALKQRFGRLDRVGRRGDNPAVILARRDVVDPKAEPDPVYGDSLRETWKWLGGSAKPDKKRKKGIEVDFGTREFAKRERLLSLDRRLKLLAPRKQAPLLLPAYLDAWAQTSPRPALEPEVALWLHGRQESAADIQLVWRADITPEDMDLWPDIVSLCPPASMEALPLPLYVARAWLSQTAAEELADLEVSGSDASDDVARPTHRSRPRPFLRWHGEESRVLSNPDLLRPGDTIVVPAAYGGCDRFGWNPETKEPVEDLGDEAQWLQRGRAVLRLHEAVVKRWLPLEDPESAGRRPPLPGPPEDSEEDDHAERVDEFLRWMEGHGELPRWLRDVAGELLRDPRRAVLAYPDGRGVVLRAAGVSPRYAALGDVYSDFTSEDDSSSFTSDIPLTSHCSGVQTVAKEFAQHCRLPSALVEDIALAGWLHDVGKADPRFQRMLHGGDEVAAAMAEGLRAKSAIQGQSAREAARRAAGFPRGERHELISLALIEASKEVADKAHDRDLLLYLVSSHHGHCRPFAPCQSPAPLCIRLRHGENLDLSARLPTNPDRLDSGVLDRFWRLIRRYGWFGLPYLEAILRLADHLRSDAEQRKLRNGRKPRGD